MIHLITRPTLLLDESKCRKNITSMFEKAKRNKVQLRPHFKTHQSHEIGRWFRDLGVNKITTSSLSMAEYFTNDNWQDITVAFPVNILEIDTINLLAGSIKLNLQVESVEVTKMLDEGLRYKINAFVKIDTGDHRTGIAFNNYALIDSVVASISKSDHIKFSGFITHAGHSYLSKGIEEISRVHYETTERIIKLKDKYSGRYPELIISTGDTPTCNVMEDFSGVDEIRPGNFVFYDLMQSRIGSCRTDEIAVAMACPVVAIHKERNEMVIYGGAVHFSKERIEDQVCGTIFGQVVEESREGWGEPIEGMYLTKLTQEHGIVHVPDHLIDKNKIGDVVLILPVHSCLTSHEMKAYVTTKGRIISRF